MHAVVLTGGKQYRVEAGQFVRVEKIEAEVGSEVTLDKVLLLSAEDNVQVGTPYLESAKVVAQVIEHGRGKKVKIIKFRRRKHSMKRMGHRQWFTTLKINTIEAK